MTWKQELRKLHLEDMKAKAPNFYEASGGDTMHLKPYTDKTANGLTKCIVCFLEFKGHYSNRINTQGQAHVHDIPRFNIFSMEVVSVGKSVTWTKGSTKKGTPDIDAIINGKPVKVEVKIGSDYMKKDQKREREKIERAGGYYFVARDMESFYEWYYKTFVNL